MGHELKYLDKHIAEELEGAECYYDKAMEHKESGHAEHMQLYMTMATQELTHAETLMRMQDDTVKKLDAENTNKGYNVYRDIWESYREERMDKYKALKDKMSKMK